MKKQSWPAWYFGPDGARAIFERAEDVPEDWQDHPPQIKDAADDAEGDGEDDDAGSAEAAMIDRLADFHLADERRILLPDDDFPNGRDVVEMATGYMEKLEAENADLVAKLTASAEEMTALRAKVEAAEAEAADHSAKVDALEAEKADLQATPAKFDHDGDGKPGGKSGGRSQKGTGKAAASDDGG